MQFKDTAFWLEVLERWTSLVTGSFSAKFMLPAWLIVLAVLFRVSPDRYGAIACAALTGVLIVGGFIYAVFETWENAHPKEIISTIGQSQSVWGIPDWTIRELFFHIRPDVVDQHADHTWDKVGLEIMDKLSTGQLKIWGRLDSNDRVPLSKIDQDYWPNAGFTYFFFSDEDGAQFLVHATPRFSRNHSGLPNYRDLQVNRAQALTIWPSAERPEIVSIKEADFIPLPDAARLVYEGARKRNRLIAMQAERVSGVTDNGGMTNGSPEDILDFMATYMGNKAQIYGTRPPSDRKELIAATEVARSHFESGALILKNDRHVYTSLETTKSDLSKILLHLEANEV